MTSTDTAVAAAPTVQTPVSDLVMASADSMAMMATTPAAAPAATESAQFAHQMATEILAVEAADEDQVAIPMCIEAARAPDKWVINLYCEECLECDALIPSGDIMGTKMRCHVAKGNPNCPAGQIQFAMIGTRMKWLNKIRSARAQDSLALGKVVSDMIAAVTAETLTPDDYQWVMRESQIG